MQNLQLPVFPQEIFDLVIDEYFEDKSWLMASSLVCRAWEHSCRRHLFSQISIPSFSPQSQKNFHRILHDYAVAVRLDAGFFSIADATSLFWMIPHTLLKFMHNLLSPPAPIVHPPDSYSTFPRTTTLIFTFDRRATCLEPSNSDYALLHHLPHLFPQCHNFGFCGQLLHF